MSDVEKWVLWCSINMIRDFLYNKCDDRLTSLIVVKEDGHELKTDWGYFEEGLNEIEAWLQSCRLDELRKRYLTRNEDEDETD